MIQALALLLVSLPAAAAPTDDWPGFRGEARNGAAAATGVFTPERGALATGWKRPLGSGYAGVAVAGGRLVTLFAAGEEDVVAAFDTASGNELWRRPLGPTYRGHDGSHDGPIATPLIAQGKVYALGATGRLLAFDLATGGPVWATDLPAEHGAKAPFYGFSSSPLLAGGTLVVEYAVQGEGETIRSSVAGFDPATGERRWTAGGSEVSYQSPIALTLAGTEQVLVPADKALYSLDPATGALLWQHALDAENTVPQGSQSMTPLPAGGDRLLVETKGDAAELLRVGRRDGAWSVEKLWTSKALGRSYAPPVYFEEHFYGLVGGFLTCVSAASGEMVWRSRPPGDGFPILVDGHLVVLTKLGSLHVAPASPEGWRERSRLDLFATAGWTAPSFAGGRLYARNLAELAAVEITADALAPRAAPAHTTQGIAPGSRFGRFLEQVAVAADKGPVVDGLLAAIDSFPLVDGESAVFLYRGEAQDMGIAGDWIGARRQQSMERVAGTDLFFAVAPLPAGARLAYRFVKDFDQPLVDPRNPRRFEDVLGETSWVTAPGWREPAFLGEAPLEQRGRIEEREVASERFPEKRKVEVYLPAGFDPAAARRYPVAYLHGGQQAREMGELDRALDHLLGASVEPAIVVFIHVHRTDFEKRPAYVDWVALDLVPFIDREYPTDARAERRASLGMGFEGSFALASALANRGVFGRVATQSMFLMTEDEAYLEPLVASAAEQPLAIFMERGRWDFRADHEGWSTAAANLKLAGFLRRRGYQPVESEALDGFGWGAWRNRFDQVFEWTFPLAP